LVATVVREINPATLAPASERQNHTTSPSASATFVSRAIRVHRIPAPRIVTIGRNVPLHRGGMRESIVVICPTEQAPTPATDWHDGQFSHGAHAEIARRATACAAASRSRHSRERTHRQRDRGKPSSLQTATHFEHDYRPPLWLLGDTPRLRKCLLIGSTRSGRPSAKVMRSAHSRHWSGAKSRPIPTP
jgi:hypothetical protein